jgi:hypothetical protein
MELEESRFRKDRICAHGFQRASPSQAAILISRLGNFAKGLPLSEPPDHPPAAGVSLKMGMSLPRVSPQAVSWPSRLPFRRGRFVEPSSAYVSQMC